jgi:hypothetical protein
MSGTYPPPHMTCILLLYDIVAFVNVRHDSAMGDEQNGLRGSSRFNEPEAVLVAQVK